MLRSDSFFQIAKSVQRLLLTAAASVNLLVYCATSAVFRKELFGCTRRRERRISNGRSLVATETVEMPLRGVGEQD